MNHPQRRRRRRLPVVLQATTTDCGPACLAMILAGYRRDVPLEELRDDLGAGRDGVTALDLRDGAKRHGLSCRAWRVSPQDLPGLPPPFVAYWEGNHFVVVERVRRSRVELIDPVLGRRRLAVAEFTAGFAGVALTFAPDASVPLPSRSGTSTLGVWRTVVLPALHVRPAVLTALATTSVLLLLAGLAVPVATAWVVNRLVAASPGEIPPLGWLPLTAVAALGLAVGALTLLRGLAAANMQQHVGRQLTGSLVDRLLDAPLQFFEHRGSGEVVSRLTATDAVRDALATQLVGAVLDTLVAFTYVVILCLASPALGLLTLALGIVQLVLLGALALRGRRLRGEELLAQARCQNWIFGVVMGFAWVKAAGAERVVRDRWALLHEHRLEALQRTARTGAVAEATAAAVRLAGPLVLMLAAASFGANGSSPGQAAGRVVGLASLATAALLPLGALAGHLRSFAELGSVVEHLGDLATARAEQPAELPAAPPFRAELVTRDLGFRHTRRGPWILRHVDVRVPVGGKLAVVGPSGSGKSTLVKLLAGLYAPVEGGVFLDGHDLQSLNLSSVRRRLGVVLQDPFLLSATVAENIALRRPDAPLRDVMAAAQLAAVHEDILALPLGYESTLANGGAGFSGGQRQRIALARALFDRPSLLVLDEATSHLDSPTEARIELNLRHLGVTRIVVAHRLSTVQDADLILILEAGRVVEAGNHLDLVEAGDRYAAMVASQELLPA